MRERERQRERERETEREGGRERKGERGKEGSLFIGDNAGGYSENWTKFNTLE